MAICTACDKDQQDCHNISVAVIRYAGWKSKQEIDRLGGPGAPKTLPVCGPCVARFECRLSKTPAGMRKAKSLDLCYYLGLGAVVGFAFGVMGWFNAMKFSKQTQAVVCLAMAAVSVALGAFVVAKYRKAIRDYQTFLREAKEIDEQAIKAETLFFEFSPARAILRWEFPFASFITLFLALALDESAGLGMRLLGLGFGGAGIVGIASMIGQCISRAKVRQGVQITEDGFWVNPSWLNPRKRVTIHFRDIVRMNKRTLISPLGGSSELTISDGQTRVTIKSDWMGRTRFDQFYELIQSQTGHLSTVV